MPRTHRSDARRSIPVVTVALAVLSAIGAACLMLPGDPLGVRIPAMALDAYRQASAAAPQIAPGCAVEWQVLAGIGRVESNHGRVDGPRTLADDGDVTPPIRGPQLDGSDGTQRIPDTDDAALDGDPQWDRAVGPLQFIPTTWAELGRDGNGDGVADPDNLYDAALTTAAHLCLREPGDYANAAELRSALVAYNNSGAYADEVLSWVTRYRERPDDELVASADA